MGHLVVKSVLPLPEYSPTEVGTISVTNGASMASPCFKYNSYYDRDWMLTFGILNLILLFCFCFLMPGTMNKMFTKNIIQKEFLSWPGL